jgi:SIR2-like protein/TIR domain-containing protein
MNINIIKALERSELVPVIGNDLSMVRLLKTDIPNVEMLTKVMESATNDGDSIKVNLNDYLAFELWNDYESGKEPPSPYTLNNVVEALVSENTTTEDEIKSEILFKTKNLTDEQIILEPFRKLARIANFETILTVNFDNFLERAFEAESKHVNPSVNFSIQNSSDSDGNTDKDKALVSIFNLMGNIQDSDIALTEEMQLEYLFSLLMGKDVKSKALFEAVKNKSILLIGCSFPNWFMRFFIRTISKNRYKTGKPKFVASDRTAQDVDLSSFLENNKTSVISIGTSTKTDKNDDEVYSDTVEFIDELFEKTESSATSVTSNKPRYKEEIFLSYSRRDQSIVEKMKNEFEKCGVQLFFDNDALKTGEEYAKTIDKKLMKFDYVLPIISKNSLENKDSFVYAKEWLPAITMEKTRQGFNLFKKEGQENYIRPYIIDDTSATDDDIPEEIRNRNITTIPVEEGFEKMVRKFIKENELTEINPDNG